MNRLTNKKVLDEMSKFPKDYTFSSEELIYIKLGHYEDIEELCEKINDQQFFYKTLVTGKAVKVRFDNSFIILYDFKNKRIHIINYKQDYVLFIEQYGKTWALTREELI